jgi:hypothetical protein
MGRAPRIDSWEMRNRQSTRCSGRAALRATNPDQPSSASASPTRWYGGRRRRPGRGVVSPTRARRAARPRGRPPRRRSPTATGPVASARGVAVPALPGAGTTGPMPSHRRRPDRGRPRGRRAASVVGWRVPVGQGRSAGVGMPDLTARPADRVDVERQALDRAWIFQLRDDAGDAPIVATGDDVQRLVVVERLDRLGEPYGDVVGVHHAR